MPELLEDEIVITHNGVQLTPQPVVSGRLKSVNQGRTVEQYVRDFAENLRLSVKLAKYQIAAEIHETKLGLAWVALSPLLIALPSMYVFGYVIGTNNGIENYPIFALVGLLAFRMLSRTWVRSAKSFRPGGRPNTPFGVPAATGVTAHTLHETVLASVGFAICIVWAIVTGAAQFSTLPLILPAIVLGFLFANGIGYGVAAVSMKQGDFAQAIPHLMRPLGLASGIWFLPTDFIDNGIVGKLFEWNPIFLTFENVRFAIIGRAIEPANFFWLLMIIGSANLVGLFMLWVLDRGRV